MKIHAMLFVGLLLEASLFASKGLAEEEFEKVSKCVIDNGCAEKIILYSVKNSLDLTAKEQQAIETAIEENNKMLSMLHDPKKEENIRFIQLQHDNYKAAKLAAEVALQRKRDDIQLERKRLKDVKSQQLLEKQQGYKEFAAARARYTELDFYP